MSLGKTMHYGLLWMALLAWGTTTARAADYEPLQVQVRREGVVPYTPYADYRITIKVPESKLVEGWTCCWIEAFSRPVAAMLSQQEQRPVAGNDVDVQLDSRRTEASLREVAPSVFEGSLYLSSTRGWGDRAARIYVHLYQPTPDYAGPPWQGSRLASDFLKNPAITVRFMYPPRALPNLPPLRPGDTVPGAPPSQLPHY